MPFPLLKSKYTAEALFNPLDYVQYKKFPRNLPTKYILTYQQAICDIFRENTNREK